MDVLASIHPLPGRWLNRSDLADGVRLHTYIRPVDEL